MDVKEGGWRVDEQVPGVQRVATVLGPTHSHSKVATSTEDAVLLISYVWQRRDGEVEARVSVLMGLN